MSNQKPPDWWERECASLAGAHQPLREALKDRNVTPWPGLWWYEIGRRGGFTESQLRGAFAALRIMARTPKPADLLAAAKTQRQAEETPVWRSNTELDRDDRWEGRAVAAAFAGLRHARRGDLLKARESLRRAIEARSQMLTWSDELDGQIAELERTLG